MSRGEPDDAALRRLLDVAAEPDPTLDALGVDVGRFTIVREIGRGGMGVVYEAEDPALVRRVALKVIAPAAGASPSLRQRFSREALAAARLRHPHIAAIHEATPDWIAMQLVDGVPLDSLDLEVRTLAALLATAADAVHYAHRNGIVHRDLKPGNLMVEGADTDAPHLYVLDFGLAKETRVDSSLSITGHLLGTPAFMAPEQASGRVHDVDERTDVYGLGATLWARIARRVPVEGDDLVRVLARVADGDTPPLERVVAGVDRDLSTIVQRAMAVEPERRYATAAAFAADLRRWLAHEPIEARRPSIGYRVRVFARRHRGALRAAAVAALVTGVAAGLYAASERAARTGARDALRLSNHVAALVRDADDAFRSGQVAVHDEKLREAIAACRAALDRHDVAQGHFLLGSLLFRSADYRAAIAALDRALALDPDLGEARFLRGLVLIEYASRTPGRGGPPTIATGHLLEQARRDLRAHRESSLPVRRVDLLYAEAQLALLEDRDVAAARERLQAIVYKLDPTHVGAIRAYASLLQETDADEARRLSARAMDLERGVGLVAALAGVAPADLASFEVPGTGPLVDAPGAVRLREATDALLRARVARKEGDVDAAAAAWRDAIARAGAALDAGEAPAACLNARGVARSELERLLAAQGRAFESTGLRMRALDDFDRAVHADPTCVAARFNRGQAKARHATHLASAGLGDHVDTWRRDALADLRATLERLPPSSPLRDSVRAAITAVSR